MLSLPLPIPLSKGKNQKRPLPLKLFHLEVMYPEELLRHHHLLLNVDLQKRYLASVIFHFSSISVLQINIRLRPLPQEQKLLTLTTILRLLELRHSSHQKKSPQDQIKVRVEGGMVIEL